jgi:hypothetical protein
MILDGQDWDPWALSHLEPVWFGWWDLWKNQLGKFWFISKNWELSCPRTIMRVKPLLLNHPNSLDTPHGWFCGLSGLWSMSCKSCTSLVWVVRSVENTAGQIHIFESELRHPTIMIMPNHCFSTILIHLIHPMDDFGLWSRLGSMSSKSSRISLVWVMVRSVENSAGQILIFERKLRHPTNHCFSTIPIHLIHPMDNFGWSGVGSIVYGL